MTMIGHAESDPHTNKLLKIIVGAIALRWIYSLLMFAAMGDAGIMGVDSIDYLKQGQLFATKLADHSLSGWDWAGTHPYMMPLFTWAVAANVLIFGKLAALGYVIIQGAIDSGTCYLVYRIARTIDDRAAIPALVAAAINPTQVVMAGLLYTDTPFVFFVALFLYGGTRWLSSRSLSAAILIGAGLGGGMLFRPLLAAWVPAMLLFLAIVAVIRDPLVKKELGHLTVIIVIFGICTAPILFRHKAQFGVWSLTPQIGLYLNRWIVPLVQQAKDGTPWQQGYLAMEKQTVAQYGPNVDNPFEQSKRYTDVATHELRRLGVIPILKAWAFGAAINLGAPAVTLSPAVALLPRTGFYDTPGATMTEKIWLFLFHASNGIYALLLLGGIVGVAVIRLVQICGALTLAMSAANVPVLLLFAGWAGYILLVNGPIASPKYRLPMEPVLMVLTGVGAKALFQRRRQFA